MVTYVKMPLFLELIGNHLCILILGKESTQGLDNTELTAEAEYSINFSRSQKFFCLSYHYNESNSFSFVNTTKIYQFKGKNSEIKAYLLCSGNILKGFTADGMKKNRIKWI